MLDAIKKKLGMAAATVEATVEAAVEAVETITLAVDTTAIATELSVMRTEFEAGISKLTADFASAKAALAVMTANFEAAQSALSSVTAEKAQMVIKTEAAKFAARKEKVVLAIGTEKADGLMLATHSLDDVAFAAVVGALAGSVDVEASTSLFAEVGVSATADTTKIDDQSPEMKILKQMFTSANGTKSI